MNKPTTPKLLHNLFRVSVIICIATFSLLLCSVASGRGIDAEIQQLNQRAMADLQEGRIDSAINLLKSAESSCTEQNIQGAVLAVTYMSMAIVAIHGDRDSAAGIEYMTKALCQDPSVQLNPLFISEETSEILKLSKDIAATPLGCGAPPPEETVATQGDQPVPACQPDDPTCDKTCARQGSFCEIDADCCLGNVCEMFTCTSTGDSETSGGADRTAFSITINSGTGVGFATGGSMRPGSKVADGDLNYSSGVIWNKMHIRVNPMLQLASHPKLKIGATFRGDVTFSADDSAPKFGSAFLANASYLIGGQSTPVGFQTHLMLGLGGGVFYHRGTYKDCEGERASSGHVQVKNGTKEKGEPVCTADALEYTDDAWRWNRDLPVEKPFFIKSGYIIAEVGLDSYYWFNNHFGLNFGLIADIMFPNFAVNLDLQAGAAVRF